MRKIADGIYIYRGIWILRGKDGWWTDDGSLLIFKALSDCREHINKRMDSTNTREPRVVREWTIEEDHN